MTQYLRDISTFGKEEINDFLKSFDTVLADGDGVLWYLNDPLPGSIETLNRLKQLGKKIFLVSNNSTISLQQYVDKAKKLNLELDEDEIIIPSVVASVYLKECNFNKKAFILASKAFKQQFESQGILCSSDTGPDHSLESVDQFREELLSLDRDVGAVVIDFDLNINFVKMNKALFHLRRPDCLFVAGSSDAQVPVQGGTSILGPGSFIATLESISGRKAVVTGKPSPLIKDILCKRHSIVPGRTLMIGDMMSMDMQLGTNCGFQKLLVLSGISKLEDTKKDPSNLPHYYLSTLGDLLPLLPTF